MQDMPRPRPPHLHRETNRHGTPVWYVRVGKGPRIRLRAEYGTDAFTEQYNAAVRGEKPEVEGKTSAGTFAWLVDRYRDSQAWLNLSIATRKNREVILRKVLKTSGREPISRINRAAIDEGLKRRRETPAAQQNFIKTVRGVFTWAVSANMVALDPTAGVDLPRLQTEGFEVWPIEWRTAFEKRWKLGTRERVAYEVLYQTGLRRGDAVRLGRPHVKDGIATIRTEKTGEIVTIVITAELQAAIDAGPVGEMTFIAGESGKPLTKESFGTWFRKACNLAGVKGSAHGLRKARATTAAERGATVNELDAMFGWRGGKMAAHYTQNADRAKLAISAAKKIATPEQPANIYSRTSPQGAGAKRKR